jgi:hypothetical protein
MAGLSTDFTDFTDLTTKNAKDMQAFPIIHPSALVISKAHAPGQPAAV